MGVVTGMAASIGQYLLVLAYRRAAASLLAPRSYMQLLSSTLQGYPVFGVVRGGMTFLGAAVIVASGLTPSVRWQRALPVALSMIAIGPTILRSAPYLRRFRF